MDIVAALKLNPGFWIFGWILAGLIAGAIAGRISRGRGYGCLGDIIVGLIGAVIGGWIVRLFYHGNATAGFLETTGVALLGALVFLFILRLIRG